MAVAGDRMPNLASGTSEREVKRVDALVHEAALRLSRGYERQAAPETASSDLRRMRPQLEGAMEALGEIEARRDLTQRELSQRRAFKVLLQNPPAE